ncbi:U3 small nucleolar RNA-associated protein 6 homolog [Rhodamnia argentea]|uniref:U3 small nucleolar RNA-associated protein 6 homolog n=1 Tax=Rhodamnia argentea TaxID=178133 RepID=A0A8B8PFG5_9MYRT|nr:U3 small nucleolar RNA-associated protein 6 homolog [Rhodamnia argentea]
MADVVQYRLERMVDELDDLERRGLFTRREIAEVVKQRRKFEYRLKRPSPLKDDFLAYIEYETQLDALRRLRKNTLAREARKKMKKSVSDFAGVARIIEIYRMAVMRYKGDIDLWFRYLEFCRVRKNGRMKKALAQVIRFHPKVPGVWIYAAAWEFDHNLNVAAARALMQSGLRLCPTSEDLWVEYLRMELTYLNKLKARRIALGEDNGTLIHSREDNNEKRWRNENQDLYMSLNEVRDIGDGSDGQNGEAEKEVDLFQKQGLVILQTIYSGAVEMLPSSMSLRKRLFEILDSINLSDSEELRKKVLGDMKRDFSSDPEYWDWLAKHQITDFESLQDIDEERLHSEVQKAVKIYEEALEILPSPELFNMYAKFFMDVIALKEGNIERSQSSGHMHSYISQLLLVYEKAETMRCLDEDLACKHVSLYLQLGRLNEARDMAGKLCSGQLSDSMQLLLLRVSVELRCLAKNYASLEKADLVSIFDLLRNVLTKASVSETEQLWLVALKVFSNQNQYFDKLVEIAFVALAKNGARESEFSLSSVIVNFVLQKDGVERAREMYRRFLALPHPEAALYRTCIELEMNLAFAGSKDCLSRVRKLYEAALTTYDQSVDLWRAYYSLENKMGTAESATAVYWRARKILKDASTITNLLCL